MKDKSKLKVLILAVLVSIIIGSWFCQGVVFAEGNINTWEGWQEDLKLADSNFNGNTEISKAIAGRIKRMDAENRAQGEAIYIGCYVKEEAELIAIGVGYSRLFCDTPESLQKKVHRETIEVLHAIFPNKRIDVDGYDYSNMVKILSGSYNTWTNTITVKSYR